MKDLSVLFFVMSVGRNAESPTCSRHLHRPERGAYHLTKECAESKMRTVATSNATDLDACAELATAKNAFAFQYAASRSSEGGGFTKGVLKYFSGPPEIEAKFYATAIDGFKNYILTTNLVSLISCVLYADSNNVGNCNVFECPEFHSFLLTTNVSVYNYYSMFSKPLPSENYTCAPGVGVFQVVADRLNYSNAMIACEDAGGHLANVGSDSRSSFLASLVSSVLANQTASFRKAFVGLFFDRDFVTVTGEPLECLPFRAWAPGHPKAGRLKKDCVVITSNRYWKTEDCTLKLPYVCELIPDGPLSPVERYCAPISNAKRRKNCIIRNHKQFENIEHTNEIKHQCYDSNIDKKTIEVTDNNN